MGRRRGGTPRRHGAGAGVRCRFAPSPGARGRGRRQPAIREDGCRDGTAPCSTAAGRPSLGVVARQPRCVAAAPAPETYSPTRVRRAAAGTRRADAGRRPGAAADAASGRGSRAAATAPSARRYGRGGGAPRPSPGQTSAAANGTPPLAPDERRFDTGQVDAARNRVILVANVALQRPEIDEPVVERPARTVRRCCRQIDLQQRTVRGVKGLEADVASPADLDQARAASRRMLVAAKGRRRERPRHRVRRGGRAGRRRDRDRLVDAVVDEQLLRLEPDEPNPASARTASAASAAATRNERVRGRVATADSPIAHCGVTGVPSPGIRLRQTCSATASLYAGQLERAEVALERAAHLGTARCSSTRWLPSLSSSASHDLVGVQPSMSRSVIDEPLRRRERARSLRGSRRGSRGPAGAPPGSPSGGGDAQWPGTRLVGGQEAIGVDRRARPSPGSPSERTARQRPSRAPRVRRDVRGDAEDPRLQRRAALEPVEALETPSHVSCTTSSATARLETYVIAARAAARSDPAHSAANASSSPARSAATRPRRPGRGAAWLAALIAHTGSSPRSASASSSASRRAPSAHPRMTVRPRPRSQRHPVQSAPSRSLSRPRMTIVHWRSSAGHRDP